MLGESCGHEQRLKSDDLMIDLQQLSATLGTLLAGFGLVPSKHSLGCRLLPTIFALIWFFVQMRILVI